MKRFAVYAGIALLMTLLPCYFPAMSSIRADEIEQPQAGADTEEWLNIPSASFTVLYKPGVNLKRIESRLRYSAFPVSRELKELYTSPTYDINRRIANRLEALLQRVKSILGMNPAMSLNIRIFRTHQELREEYYRLFRNSQDYPAFYIHGLKTIYTSEQDMLDLVIAHEMGHAVIDHYFNVIPPEKIAETIASYVDSHLERD